MMRQSSRSIQGTYSAQSVDLETTHRAEEALPKR